MDKLLLLVLLGWTAGCRTPASLPPANLSDPGWTVRQGQAVWRQQSGGEGIAGEILVASRTNGLAFVEFSKGPFPLIVAQSTPKAWAIKLPAQNEEHSGRGLPPQRIIFLYLPRVVAGLPPPTHWSWQPLERGGQRLENHVSGEALDVYLRP